MRASDCSTTMLRWVCLYWLLHACICQCACMHAARLLNFMRRKHHTSILSNLMFVAFLLDTQLRRRNTRNKAAARTSIKANMFTPEGVLLRHAAWLFSDALTTPCDASGSQQLPIAPVHRTKHMCEMTCTVLYF